MDGVTGVAVLDDIVYMVAGMSSKIMCFNVSTHRRLKDMRVQQLRSACDIAACHQTSRLYVADETDQSIWQVDVSSGTCNYTHIILDWDAGVVVWDEVQTCM